MAKEKVTVTLDAERLAQLRELVGGRSLSAALDAALDAHLVRLRHLAAVDGWLAELDAEHGPVPPADRAWAAGEVSAWSAAHAGSGPGRRAG